jgi:anti-sigma factor RsiW
MKSEFEMNPCQPWEVPEAEDEQFQRFELLSAYIDGEATPQECKLVQGWLDTDPALKQAYLGLIRLQTALPHVPVPPSMPTEQLSQQIFERLEQETRRPRLWLWGGLTTAAIAVAACSSIFVNPLQPASQQANLESQRSTLAEDPLMIAINEPLFYVLEED